MTLKQAIVNVADILNQRSDETASVVAGLANRISKVEASVEEAVHSGNARLDDVESLGEQIVELRAHIKRLDTELANLRSQFHAFDAG